MTAAKTDKVRLDKWLWAARFFKTRALAAEAVNRGKVQVGGVRVKPAHTMRLGETLTIRIGVYEYQIIVQKLSRQRGPAKQAVLLYQETTESLEKRELLAAQIKLQAIPRPPGRPNKKDRRQIIRFTRERE